MFFYTTLSAYSKLLMLTPPIGELAVMYIESHCPDNSTDILFYVTHDVPLVGGACALRACRAGVGYGCCQSIFFFFTNHN